MRAEIEAVTLGLKTVDDLLPDDRHIIIATDSQSLLRKLETGLSLREWWSNKRITWVYCPGHSDITVNEKADRLAGDGSNCTSRIVLAASDFIKLLRHQITEDEENKPKAGVAELERMARLGLRRGWLRRSSDVVLLGGWPASWPAARCPGGRWPTSATWEVRRRFGAGSSPPVPTTRLLHWSK